MDTQALKEKIRQLEGLTDEERNGLLALLNHQKKYGLVWEEKPEEVEERLRVQLPVLEEVKERVLLSNDPAAPNHILIEGDNLEALVALTYTHEGKVDVIYIDPPYNTGNKDFSYNDSFVDAEDGYRHSKWLSFMSKRLKIAKQLLSDRGVIFISIDDNEVIDLVLICNELFGEQNKIGLLPTIMNLKGNQDEFGFAGTHEYTIVYAKNKDCCSIGQLKINEDDLDAWLEDEIGFYKKGATLKRTGTDSPRNKRPYGYYPILIDTRTLKICSILEEEYKGIYNAYTQSFNDDLVERICVKYSNQGLTPILPIVNGDNASWRWGYNTVKRDAKEIIVVDNNGSYSLYKKQRPQLGDLPTKKAKSVLYKPQYSSGNGTAQLQELGLGQRFNNPKPIELMSDLLVLGGTNSSIILDFFAGSGTTLHATMQLNKEDGGHRQCILVTNNENKICEEVTYVRNKQVIQGYVTPKGDFVEGLKANTLRYYRTKLLPRVDTNQNRRALMAACTELLCIEQDLYEEQPCFAGRKLNPRKARYFAQEKRRMLVIYDEQTVDTFAELLREMEVEERIRIYLFSFNGYPHTDNFMEVLDKVELCALPQAIYNVYNRVLPTAVEPVNEEEERP